MSKRTLIITHDIDQHHIQQLNTIAPTWNIITGKNRANWENHIPQAEIIAGWKPDIDQHLFTDQSPLKWLQVWSAGINNYPLDKLNNHNILLTTANGVHAYPISETIFALMLGLTRKIHTYVQQQQQKKWHHAGMELELHHKTIGIIGAGAIGQETAKIAKAFGMIVHGIRTTKQPAPYIDHIHTIDNLHHVLTRCDYIVNALPSTPDTEQLITKEAISHMKKTAFFINIGRGDTVDQNALIQALQQNKIAGAGLDVFEQEPLDPNNPLWDMPNVIITPHTAGSTEFYNKRVMEDIFIPNFQNYINNQTPDINLVDYQKGY